MHFFVLIGKASLALYCIRCRYKICEAPTIPSESSTEIVTVSGLMNSDGFGNHVCRPESC